MGNGREYFLPSFIFLLASCFSFILDIARYAFELTTNNLLKNQTKPVQNLMTDWGLIQIRLGIVAMLSLICAIVERDYQIAFMSNKVGS